ncbi:MAG: hypothetical protein ACE5PV_22445, partial [Candidatus Poribacteria bacterium]
TKGNGNELPYYKPITIYFTKCYQLDDRRLKVPIHPTFYSSNHPFFYSFNRNKGQSSLKVA